MKKNKMMRIASVLLVAVLLSTCAISGTFAKYTSTATATATATVAKWNVTLEDKAFTETITFNFTETWTDSNGSAESDVASKKLAPGTKGSFDLKVTNSSEVNAQYKIVFDFSALEDLPLTYTYKVDGVASDAATIASFTAINMNANAVITVEWEWPFDNNDDEGDTALGVAGATFDVSATVTVEQVD